MTQVRQYCAHALESLQAYRRGVLQHIAVSDLKIFDAVLGDLHRAEKFHLPTNGRYLHKDDPYTPQDLELIRLPYPLVALEFGVSGVGQPMPGQDPSTRRIILCRGPDPQGNTEAYAINYNDVHKDWTLSPVATLIPPPEQMDMKMVDVDRLDAWQRDQFKPGTRAQAAKFSSRVILPVTLEKTAAQLKQPVDRLADRMMYENLQDISIVFEFLLTINCSNVDYETLPPPAALNKKRTRNGKLPFYEYKVLKLSSTATRYALTHDRQGAVDTGEVVARRQHLRRGHIRHYDPARTPRYRKKASVWIEAMIVGSGEVGRIDKEYSLG